MRKHVNWIYRSKNREYQKDEIRSIKTNGKENNSREMLRIINAIRKDFSHCGKNILIGYCIGDELHTAVLYIDEPTYQELDTAIKTEKQQNHRNRFDPTGDTQIWGYRAYFQNTQTGLCDLEKGKKSSKLERFHYTYL